MAKRALPARQRGGNYFPGASKTLKFIPSGCAVLDGVLGFGWPLGRIVNIVGDRSSGKTLLAIEACANFAMCSPKGKIWYREAEAAFDLPYANRLGLPEERVNFGPKGVDTIWDTIEDIFEDLDRKLSWLEDHPGVPALYIIDSLDALTSRAEIARKVDQGSYGDGKAKKLSELFRRLVRRIKRVNLCLIVISQVRDKIGAMFGDKHTRSGGRALDFYASIIIWLHHIKTLRMKVSGMRVSKGVRILAKTKKNKISEPFRECQFDIRFGYGVDDLPAALDWLYDRKRLHLLDLKASQLDTFLAEARAAPPKERAAIRTEVRAAVLAAWKDLSQQALPPESKYG
jgi:recombination protein RecA